eukprot:CAMPEP_0174260122 /NCGR_PEP_ID=MMETSP0439-20130205/8857_1 /TAXON_ID=0 /ORGANISM="Stereomyxa ramosa, Strain Chinc5" /LENGTH=389 /DNA_ID=CAMNT_0015344293 /DNA_START=312 /DNA_END=1481 /DNA_ORIENTATION=+
MESANKKWGSKGVEMKARILELLPLEECVVTGTLYKEMPLRPDVLKYYAEKRSILPPVTKENYVSKDDVLILEDDSGRIQLIGAVNPDILVTGIIAAVIGRELETGEFQVDDMIFTGFPKQIPRQIPNCGQYIAIISGIRLGDPNSDPLLLQLFVDYITGHSGSTSEQNFVSKISKVIIAGNSIVEPDHIPDPDSFNKKVSNELMGPLKEFDQMLAELASSVEVDVMPGEDDPTNFTLPQQPLNPCLLPISRLYPTLRCVTNPYLANINNSTILGNSGQCIDDIKKYVSEDTTTLEIMELLLNSQHTSPTAPDTLGCYPFYETDPFVMKECPHLFFTANQDSYEHKLVKGEEGQEVVMVTVPSFAKSGTIVLIDSDSLLSYPIRFSLSL